MCSSVQFLRTIKHVGISIATTTIIMIAADAVLARDALGIDLKKLTKRHLVNDPLPSLAAESIDQTANWYDDNPSATSKQEWELEFDINPQYDLKLRQTKIAGIHNGEATTYTCVAGFCSHIGAGLISGNTATDVISYNIETLQVMIQKESQFFGQTFIKPRVGLNLLDITLKYSGVGKPKSDDIVMPIPIVGVYSELPLNGDTKLYFESNLFAFDINKTKYKHIDTYFGVSHKISETFEFIFGFKKIKYSISNTGGSANIQLDIKQNTPFLGVSVIFSP